MEEIAKVIRFLCYIDIGNSIHFNRSLLHVQCSMNSMLSPFFVAISFAHLRAMVLVLVRR